MTTRNRKRIREARDAKLRASALLEKRRIELVESAARLREVGRVLSAANEDKLRTALSAIEDVLAALGDDSDSSDEAAKEAKRAKSLKLAEAYSAAATDAGTGAWILSSLLDLMSEESDEPDELAVLNVSFQMLSQWIAMEVASIGSPDDVDDSSTAGGYGSWMMGWESVRKRLEAEPLRKVRASDDGMPDGMVTCPTCDGEGKIKEGTTNCPDCDGKGYVSENSVESKKEARRKLLEGSKRVVTDLVPLVEAAVSENGETGVKLIAPGWGSTGYYSPEVLEAGASVFPAGTKMFWDHPTLSEEWERPERSLRDLAAELTTDAVWNADGPAGAGLYANAKVFTPFREVLNEIGPSIGVSIVAYGKAESGTAEGKSGTLITELVAADSVDFVTYPGAGGQVLSLFEAARQPRPIKPQEATMEVEKDPKFVALRERADRDREKLLERETKDAVIAQLSESQLPEITRKRFESTLAVNPPVKDGELDKAALEQRVKEAIDREIEYLAELTSAGRITGMGATGPSTDDLTPKLEEAFKRLGHDDAAARVAASGRR